MEILATRPSSTFNAVDSGALVLLIIGGINWALVGLFGIDIVATFLGSGTLPSRLAYLLLGLSGLWGLALFRHNRSRRR